MNLYLYPTSCVILHERTVHGALAAIRHHQTAPPVANLDYLIIHPTTSSICLHLYIQVPASSLSSYSFYAYIESTLTALSSLHFMYLTKQIIHLLHTQLSEKSKQYEDG